MVMMMMIIIIIIIIIRVTIKVTPAIIWATGTVSKSLRLPEQQTGKA